MPSSDEHPGRDVIGEHSLGTRRRVGKTEFVADVARAQCGVVDDRAEGDAVLQVGKEHRAGEVARADDVNARDGRVESRRHALAR